MTSSQLSDQSMYSRGQVLTRDFNTLRSLIVQIIMNTRLLLGGTGCAFSACIPAAGQHSHVPAGRRRQAWRHDDAAAKSHLHGVVALLEVPENGSALLVQSPDRSTRDRVPRPAVGDGAGGGGTDAAARTAGACSPHSVTNGLRRHC
jgi:hypothetical protein